MRLLFDQNLSHKLVRRLADVLPDSVHVRDLGLKSANDQAIAKFALEQGLTIVSKDADFWRCDLCLASMSEWFG